MKKHITFAMAIAILAGSWNTGCNEDKNESSPVTTMRTTAFDGAQGNCTNGGVKIEVLVDDTVDDAQTQYICNGAQGQDGAQGQNGLQALATTTDEVGENCASGGTRIDLGLDVNNNNTLDADEILSTRYICNGAVGEKGENGENGTNGSNASIQTTPENAGEHCTNGGVKVDILINGEIQEGQTQYICNGAKGEDGLNGQNGHQALVATSDAVGENCDSGGIRVDSGLDANDNNTLDTDEILSTRYICNGADGKNGQDGTNGKQASIQTTSFTDAQGNCANGGIKVEVLMDGVVQADQTQYICHGAKGEDGLNGTNTNIQTTSFTGAQNGCTNGGVKLEVLVDGVVQSAQTQYLCNGTNGQNGQNGQDGQNGHNALVSTSSDVGSNCANGGTRMDFGLDANDNNLLDASEILSTRYVCNGADGQDGQNGQDGTNGTNASIKTTSFTGAQNGCTNDGVKVEVLVDGVVQTAQTQYICNGSNGTNGENGQDGQNGHNALVATSDADAAHCANGGTRMDFGLDANNNGILNNTEILSTRYVCNGADGQDGQNGTNGTSASVKTTTFNGAQNGCTNGGIKVEVLVDNVVQTAQTQYICNGSNGTNGDNGQDGQNGHNALVATADADAAHCANGGIRLSVGLDENNNNILDDSEIQNTRYVCNSASGGNPCAVGKWFDGDACRPDDAEHCRGVDCTTAIAHWSDGICTESGECQVTACTGDTHLYDDGTSTICENNTSEHCGSHTTNCGEGSECVNGACSGGIIQDCNGVLTDVLTDIDNCGTCGNACAYGLDCISGRCLGNANCNGETHDTKTDLDHCGECNHRCSDGTTCINGECVIGEGPTYCGTQTVQLNTPLHCDSCARCADGLICQNNQCISGQGPMICNSFVVDSRTDSANCGSCGNVCQAGFECVNSLCKRITNLSSSTTITCNAKTVTPYSDDYNCTGCGIVCAAGNKCIQGGCVTPAIGDVIYFGHYEQDNDTTNGKEPIAWRVLNKKSDDQLFVISEKVLDVKAYSTHTACTTWYSSTIRSWLNGYNGSNNCAGTDYTSNNFINTAFTTAEKAKKVGEIWLPAISSIQNYMATSENRKADATRYAVMKGVGVTGSESGKYSSDGTCTDIHCYATWWLQSEGSFGGQFEYVTSAGSVLEDSGRKFHGIRPAMWIQY